MHNYLINILAEQEKVVQRLYNNADAFIGEIMQGKHQRENTNKFSQALKKTGLSIIAEIKRQSPSKGHFADIKDPIELAQQYINGGANAISVLTNKSGFNGDIEDLQHIAKLAAATECAVLRKDFIIDELQIAESIAAGANAVLLIACVLKDKTEHLLKTCHKLGIEAVVEVSNQEELEFALSIGASLIAVNNRDLTTFAVDTNRAIDLKKYIPDSIISIAASGIANTATAVKYQSCGYDAILVGEALVKSNDPKAMIQQMRSAV